MPWRADPQSTGWISCCKVASRITWRISFRGQRLLLQQAFHQFVAVIGQFLQHRLPRQFGFVAQARRESAAAVGLGSPSDEGQPLHLDQIDHAAEGFGDVGGSRPHGDLQRDRIGLQPIAHFLNGALEIGPFAVQLVDEGDPRDVVLVGLTPDRLALSLDALPGAEDDDGAVQHAQAAFDFGREVDVAGRVDQVDVDIAPAKGDAGRIDRDAALLFLFVEVGFGRSLVDFADAMRRPAVEQHPFGDGRLPGIDVGDDADVPEILQDDASWLEDFPAVR